MKKLNNYIGGEWASSANKSYLSIFDPATGEPYGEVARSDLKDVERAVQAAEQSLKAWKLTTLDQRRSHLMAIASGIEKRSEEFAKAESLDNGKPLSLARSLDIPRAIANFRFFAETVNHIPEEKFSTPEAETYIYRSPLGIVGAITPWNLPIYLLSWKLAPALVTGNAVIAKPSEVTPLTATLLMEVIHETSIPKGVVNLVHGTGLEAGAALVSHPKVRGISFTGGTATGEEIAKLAAPHFKKISLELGGKNPSVIFDDCDFETTVRGVVRSSFLNQGEICLCSSRLLVQKSIYEKFKAEIIPQVKALKVGDPMAEGVDQGAIVSEAHFKKIVSAVERARTEGGKILTGGEIVKVPGRCERGWFYAPTIIEALSNECLTNQEEIFGPVVTLIPFADEREAIDLANQSSYGLSASVWTRDIQRAKRVSEQIDCGVQWINSWLIRDLRTPFGGMKNSGLGREGGLEALRFVTEVKSITVKI